MDSFIFPYLFVGACTAAFDLKRMQARYHRLPNRFKAKRNVSIDRILKVDRITWASVGKAN